MTSNEDFMNLGALSRVFRGLQSGHRNEIRCVAGTADTSSSWANGVRTGLDRPSDNLGLHYLIPLGLSLMNWGSTHRIVVVLSWLREQNSRQWTSPAESFSAQDKFLVENVFAKNDLRGEGEIEKRPLRFARWHQPTTFHCAKLIG